MKPPPPVTSTVVALMSMTPMARLCARGSGAHGTASVNLGSAGSDFPPAGDQRSVASVASMTTGDAVFSGPTVRMNVPAGTGVLAEPPPPSGFVDGAGGVPRRGRLRGRAERAAVRPDRARPS